MYTYVFCIFMYCSSCTFFPVIFPEQNPKYYRYTITKNCMIFVQQRIDYISLLPARVTRAVYFLSYRRKTTPCKTLLRFRIMTLCVSVFSSLFTFRPA